MSFFIILKIGISHHCCTYQIKVKWGIISPDVRVISMDDFIDYYRVLVIKRNATKEEIKAAYRKQAKKYHPDAGGSHVQFLLIKQAYDTLYHDVKRMNYDSLYDAHMNRAYTNYSSMAGVQGEENRSNRNQQQHDRNFHNERPRDKNRKKKTTTGSDSTYLIVSILINILLAFTLLAKPYYDNQKTKDVSQEEYNQLKYRQSLLEGQYAELQKEYYDQVSYIEELEKKAGITKETLENTEQRKESPHADYFTLGSTKETVRDIMGPPDTLKDNQWSYHFSTVTFQDNKVVGWNNFSNNLLIYMKKTEATTNSFTVGSSIQEVINAMGTPDSITGEEWLYKYSTIRFNEGKVTEWNDVSGVLKIE